MKPRLFTTVTRCLAAVAIVLAATSSVSAAFTGSIVQSSVIDTTGNGFGTHYNLLTLQRTGQEAGGVSWNGTANVLNDAIAGSVVGFNSDPTAGGIKSTTLAISQLTGITAQNLLIIYNVNQTGNSDPTQLNNLVLSAYSATGTLLGSSTLNPSPVTGLTVDGQQGQGGDGYVFAYTNVVDWITVFTDPTNRIGLFADVSGPTNDGAENFYIAANPFVVTAVPAPATLFGAISGLPIGLFALRRRFRRGATAVA